MNFRELILGTKNLPDSQVRIMGGQLNILFYNCSSIFMSYRLLFVSRCINVLLEQVCMGSRSAEQHYHLVVMRLPDHQPVGAEMTLPHS